MKIKITEADCNGYNVGDVIDVEGDEMPAWAVNKAVETDERPKAKRVAVVNPAKVETDEKPE